HMRDLIERHAQLVTGVRALDREIARAHADHVRAYGQGNEAQPETRRHHVSVPSGVRRMDRRALRILRYMIRASASTGTDRKVPAPPANSAPANTPNGVGSGCTTRRCRIRGEERM